MDYVSEISSAIMENDMALFCGAGISKHSGFPLANELKREILEELPIDEGDSSDVMKSVLPFEAFMEIISVGSDISKILHIFEDGKPNTNHALLAKLVKMGCLKTILTTNFDSLIEKALEIEGLKLGVDFKSHFAEEHFSHIDLDDYGNMTEVFNIHGSIRDMDSIRTTLMAVASKNLSDMRSSVVRHIFSTGKHKRVLVLGYSCSDVFDLTPHILTLGEDLKELIFVEHCDGARAEIMDIEKVNAGNPFRRFPGKWVRCDTDELVRQLWNSLRQVIGDKYEFVTSQSKWRNCVHDWATDLEEKGKWRGYYVVALLFNQNSDYHKAIE